MNTRVILFSAIISAGMSACGGSENDTSANSEEFIATAEENESSDNANGERNSKGNYWQKMVMLDVRDNNGTIQYWQPLPANWKFHTHSSDGVSLTGPNGIKVTDFPLQSFMVDYTGNGMYSGMQMRAMPSIDDLIQQDLIPSASQRGLQYVRHYELPDVSRMNQWYADQLYSVGPTTKFNKAYGIDWKDAAGRDVFAILHVSSTKGQYSEMWNYRASLLEADPSAFAIAKKQYIFSLANMRYNLEPIMAYNQAEAQRIGQSWAAFNRRMAANQAAFEASQRAHINKTNAINDAIMSKWRSSNAASDKNQEQFIDYVYENQNVVNEETGQKYKVQQGYNQYWMNNDGEYIGTPSNTYNPNLDDNLNEQNWQRLKQTD